MGILGTVKGFASGLNWVRIALVAGIAIAIFGLGYLYSDKKHAEREAEYEAAKALEIANLMQEHANQVRELALVAAGKERQFTADIEEIETHRDALIEQIRTVALTKPAAEVRVEACLESDDEDVQVVVANPFSESFRVLWNQASRNLRHSGSEGTTP